MTEHATSAHANERGSNSSVPQAAAVVVAKDTSDRQHTASGHEEPDIELDDPGTMTEDLDLPTTSTNILQDADESLQCNAARQGIDDEEFAEERLSDSSDEEQSIVDRQNAAVPTLRSHQSTQNQVLTSNERQSAPEALRADTRKHPSPFSHHSGVALNLSPSRLSVPVVAAVSGQSSRHTSRMRTRLA